MNIVNPFMLGGLLDEWSARPVILLIKYRFRMKNTFTQYLKESCSDIFQM